MPDAIVPDAKSSPYVAAAQRAAPAFGLEPASIEILSHSENVVCDLTLPTGNHLVMRLHRPGYNTLAEMESEVQWVSALRDAGLPVPAAVPTTNGGYYTTVDVAGDPVYVGVVEWVAGVPLGGAAAADGKEVVSHYRRIGELLAQVRAHHGQWPIPETFARRRWDADGLVGDAPLWGRFWEVDALSDAQRELFTRTRNVLVEQLAALPTDDHHFGLIHSDLHLANVMADGDELTIIDFDDSGFGWFAHDIAVALHPVLDEPWFTDARAALLAGYRTVHPIDGEEESWIGTFLTMRCLMLIGWLDARPEVPAHEYFADIAAQTEAACTRYLSARE